MHSFQTVKPMTTCAFIFLLLSMDHCSFFVLSARLFDWEGLSQRSPSGSYYDILHLHDDATTKAIKKAYRKLAMSLHPDKLDIRTEEEKNRAEENFVRLAQAYEVLSDEKVKRKRYDFLLGEGILEYPNDLNYNWAWVDTKIGLSLSAHDSGNSFWRSEGRSSYERARQFYEEEKPWNWETDTTLQDIKDNKIFVFVLLFVCGYFLLPLHYKNKVFKYISKFRSKKNIKANILSNQEQIEQKEKRMSKESQGKRKEPTTHYWEGESKDKAIPPSFCDIKNDFQMLLEEHIEDIILIFSLDADIEWSSVGEMDEISLSDIKYVCTQIGDSTLKNEYAETISNAFSNASTSRKQKDEVLPSLKEGLRKILCHVVRILNSRAKACHKEENDKAVGNKYNKVRMWDATMIKFLVKGANKYKNHRNRWDLVADYMNHVLSPEYEFTKAECIQKAQNIRDTRDQITAPIEQTVIASSETSSQCMWSVEQQRQLESGLESCSQLRGEDKWTEVAKSVEGKNPAECKMRFQYIRNELKRRKRKTT